MGRKGRREEGGRKSARKEELKEKGMRGVSEKGMEGKKHDRRKEKMEGNKSRKRDE